MNIPFLDLGAATAELGPEIEEAVLRVVRSGWYILGPEVEAFEADYAAYCGADHCIGVANGLDALKLVLAAMDIGSGDEVIVPSNTFIATLLAVSQLGALPVLVEPDPRTFNIDPDRIEAAITPRTRAIIPVHLYGQPADLDPILDVAHRHGLMVLEDAAQAQGSRYKGRRIGAHGDAVAWSFYPGKNLGALGDAGAITTNDAKLAARLRMLRNYGSSRKYENEEVGYNSRLDPIHAAVLRVKLAHLDDWNQRRRKIADLYRDQLSGPGLVVPFEPNWAESAWHVFVVQHPERDELQRKLAARGVQSLIHYPIPPHEQQAYRACDWAKLDYPIASRMARQVLSLPMGPQLSLDSAREVIAAVNEVLSLPGGS